MKLPIEWLKAYVDIEDLPQDHLVDRLIMTGSNSEGVHVTAKGIEKVVVGRIDKISAHPEAEKLVLCQTDIGEETVQILTAATHMKEKDYVPVALHGATLAEGLKIKKGKLRGEVSNGMFCSLEELGVEKNAIPKFYEDGLLILDQAYPLGTDVVELLKLNEPVIEFEITPNRPDCLSIIGLAKEVAATFDKPLKTFPVLELSKAPLEGLSLVVEDSDKCPRYMAKCVKDVQIKPSPLWMQIRLIQAGMRPINNMVDITNYVMLELGQPIHAFDFDAIQTGKIGVRCAVENETIETLDGKERALERDMLVITDGSRPIAIAGVMGGADTEVSAQTTNVLLEVAHFDKSNIRKTSKDLGLRSEASSRFEKGVSEHLVETAMARLCYWIETLEVGTVVSGTAEHYPSPKAPIQIPYDAAFINKIIGTTLSDEAISDLLEKLEIETVDGVAHIPLHRLDLLKPIDLVEEVARMYGYDQIHMTLPKMNAWGAYTNAQLIEERAKHELFCNGVNEILTYSFVSSKDLDKIRTSAHSVLRNQVQLINPLGEEYSTMRSTLMPNVLEVLSRNYNRKNANVRLFELGSVFLPKEMPIKSQPLEKKMLTIGAYGEQEDFFTIKGTVEAVLTGLGIEGYRFEKEVNHPTYHKGRCANVFWHDHLIGTLGELHPMVLENYNIGSRAYVADLDFNILLQLAKEVKLFKAIPKFPAIERDMAVVVEESVTNYDVESVVKSVSGELLESVKLFDVYRGPQIGDGNKSVAYALVFRAQDRTLTDEEINPVFEAILKALEEKVNAQLR